MVKRGTFKKVSFRKGDIITLADTNTIRNALFDKLARENKGNKLKYNRVRRSALKTIQFRII